MSLGQIGENSVTLTIEEVSFSVRELEITDDILKNSKVDTHQLLHSWKNFCLTQKNIKPKLSNIFKGNYAMRVLSENLYFEIHYTLEQSSFGLNDDKKLKALAAIFIGRRIQ